VTTDEFSNFSLSGESGSSRVLSLSRLAQMTSEHHGGGPDQADSMATVEMSSRGVEGRLNQMEWVRPRGSHRVFGETKK